MMMPDWRLDPLGEQARLLVPWARDGKQDTGHYPPAGSADEQNANFRSCAAVRALLLALPDGWQRPDADRNDSHALARIGTRALQPPALYVDRQSAGAIVGVIAQPLQAWAVQTQLKRREGC